MKVVIHQNLTHWQNEGLAAEEVLRIAIRFRAMFLFLRHLIGWIIGSFHSRQELILEKLNSAPTAACSECETPSSPTVDPA